MPLFSLGLNHTTAPLALRERVAFPPERVTAALRDLAQRFNGAFPGNAIQECAIISTCNRTELYVVSDDPALATGPAADHPLCRWLATADGVAVGTLVPHLYSWREADAVRHAFRVACGLDSMVLGEPQILGQMKQAARDAEDAGTLGTLLHQVFQRTFAVAKEVRSSTQIGAHSVSMAAASVRLAQRIFERISDQHVLFIGAGEMIELTATHFAAQQPKSITIANRTLERGEKLAAHFGGRAIRLSDLPDQLAHYDIVISCTASSLPIIGLGMIERATRQRRHKPMFMVDLAVPRDIEAEAARLDDIYLYTVDDLGKIVATGMENRQAAVAQAEAIIETELQQFMRWLDARSMVPVIRELHAQGEALRQAELERAQRMLARGEDPAAVLEALSHGLANKFLHGPTQILHTAPDEARAHLIEYLPRLFQVNERK